MKVGSRARARMGGEEGRPRWSRISRIRNGVGEDGNKVEAAVAAGAVERIDVIDSAEQCGPFETGKS